MANATSLSSGNWTRVMAVQSHNLVLSLSHTKISSIVQTIAGFTANKKTKVSVQNICIRVEGRNIVQQIILANPSA